ncbi:trithorax group protein osa isoform X2 [Parasteatoda tepidariorum]|uniref:trithorax group protein osa isoform X2 n=1 Tax=Parasteatoda tepidariorum TaxID=114398 RepID=UPI0039BCFD3B
MDSSNQSISHSQQLSTQGYSHQLQQSLWTGNKVCHSPAAQSTNVDPYSQQMSRYYQAPYPPQTNDMSRYASGISKDQNSNSVAYSQQYPVARPSNYPCVPSSQSYQSTIKNNCSNNMYYNNINSPKNIPSNNLVHAPKKFTNSSLGHPQATSAVPQSSQVSRPTTPMPQMPQYADHSSFPVQNVFVSNYSSHSGNENEQSYMLPQTMAQSTTNLSVHDAASIHSVNVVPQNQVSQVSSIPTPPETSSLPHDTMTSVDNVSADGSEGMKMNMANSSFALPGMVSHLPNNLSSVSSMSNVPLGSRNSGNSLQPPPNLDEGSQASSASASSSIPDEQNVKTNSKPNFSYPPTPNTLSSPGAASMSSFHDDLECISSPGWPKTPASPRPENLLKLYTLSDEPDRRYFLDKLIVFNEDRGSPITQCPTISKQPLDVFRVYLTVKERGGFVEVTNAKRWKDIAGAIGVGASSSAAYTLRKQYMKLLLPFECKFDRGGVDPQPIINMVEASSRKKGKNSPSYGNQNPYNQNYSPVMDRYSGYSNSYQSSRYQCNNAMDYQCSSNPVHFPPNTPHNASHNMPAGPNQYNQYSHGSQSNYGYYSSNNSTSPGFNSTVPNNVNNNVCQFGRSATSTPLPQESGFYPQQYSSQQGQSVPDAYNPNRGCSMETMLSTTTNQGSQDSNPYSATNAIGGPSGKAAERVQHSKPTPDNYGNISLSASHSSSVEISQDKMSFSVSYSANKNSPDQNSVVEKSFAPGAAVAAQTYQQTIPENQMTKPNEMNYFPEQPSTPHQISPQFTGRNQGPYLNQSQSSFSNQKLPYQGEFANKDVHSNQYARFTDSQNESYRGSEGPPAIQVDRSRVISCNENVQSPSKVYQYSNSSSKNNMYNYGVQQSHSKDVFNNTAYCNPYNTRPQRAWHPEQNQHPYPMHPGQRPQMKNPLNASEGKQSDVRLRKAWVPFRDSSQVQNKLQNSTASISALSQNISSNKIQPQNNSVSGAQVLPSPIKKPLEFPPNTVESVKPVAVKRRRCPAKRISPLDPWRLMLSLRSGLLVESTWALDALAILLADNSTVIYFNLNHLPGLLHVLVDYYRCFLNKIFNLAKDLEINKTEKSSNDLQCGGTNNLYDWEGKVKILDSYNFTYKTRCKKKVEIEYDEALFLIDPQRTWDIYEDFEVCSEHWQKGGGDITSHIQTVFASESKKIKFSRELINEKTKVKSRKILSKDKCTSKSCLYKEPIVVLKKFNFLVNKLNSLNESDSEMDIEDNCSILSSSSILSKKTDNSKKEDLEKDSVDSNDGSSKAVDIISNQLLTSDGDALITDAKCEADVLNNKECKTDSNEFKESLCSSESNPRLRGSLSSRKRFLSEEKEDEAYCFDEPALCTTNDSQEMLSRRCVCVSTILRNLSFVPNNDIVMGKNPGVLVLLGRLLLLHHEHKPSKPYHKYERDIDLNMSWNDSCTSLKDEQEWWWSTLNVLRDNTLVILSNISGQLDLSPFPEEVSLPILDGLLHWVVCPSSYAQDPLPSRSPSSVLSPQRLCLEALCKLSVLSNNLDLIIATPPWSRIESLLAFLTKCLSFGQDQIMREFALILLSNISQADTVAARTIAEQGCGIPYLISFIEEAEANAFQIASSQGTKKLRDKPELMGTTPGMVQRAAKTLKNLALVPENQSLFMRFQPRLLSLVMSQVMDQELAAIIADVLFYCSEDVNDVCNQLPIS